jgi:hypothetical protein
MPEVPLPPKLVERLRRSAHRLEIAFDRMPNGDHRGPYERTRVRRMDVRRNRGEPEIIIKEAHNATAQETIYQVIRTVKNHNLHQAHPDYDLLEPHAYAISPKLIAMAKTNSPTAEEVLGNHFRGRSITPRGARLLERLNLSHDITAIELNRAVSAVTVLTGIRRDHLLILGYEGGKFRFMPLLDLG